MIKLIIWDLDDTLWSGTLAEGDKVELYDKRADAIRILNEQGIVSSICSKNNLEDAQQQLERFGLWDQFVFPEIRFEPKGQLVERIINDMSLRAVDVVFADDNDLNLREVAFHNPGIVTVDATTKDLDELLEELVVSTEGKSKSRLTQYRILQRKRQDRTVNGSTNEAFLATCGVKMTVLERTDNLPHAKRIEELINRTNQLNYLKTRVEDGSLTSEIIESTKYFTYSAFVWDKYGNYGLVGYASVKNRRTLEHFTFSCRTMNMGIESALAFVVSQRCLVESYPVTPSVAEWITIVPDTDPEFREILAASDAGVGAPPTIRIMANCQSAALAHYMPGIASEFDNYPRVFTLPGFARFGHFPGSIAPFVAYGAFVDYEKYYWGEIPSTDDFRNAAISFIKYCESNGSKLICILPSEDFTVVVTESGQTPERYRILNDMWRDLASTYANVSILEMADLPGAGPSSDPRHFDRDTLVELARQISRRTESLGNKSLPKYEGGTNPLEADPW